MIGPRTPLLPVLAGTLLASALMAGPALASSAEAAAPYCGQVWGSLPEAGVMTTAPEVVTDVRAGRHACFDRLVIDLRGPADRAPSYDVRYVDAVSEQGSGTAVPLRGGAAIQILVGAAAYDDQYQPTYLPADRAEVVDVSSYDTFRQVAWAGSFEGQTSLALGVRARLPFRVFTLLGEPGSDRAVRLVVDVGHRW